MTDSPVFDNSAGPSDGREGRSGGEWSKGHPSREGDGSVAAGDVTLRRMEQDLRRTTRELQVACEDLSGVNQELRTTGDEMEAAGRELRSINEELRRYAGVVDHLKGLLVDVMDRMEAGVIVLDAGGRVRQWNGWCERIWGLAAADVVGKELSADALKLPAGEVRALLAGAGEGGVGRPREVVDGTGRKLRFHVCRFGVTPGDGGGTPVVLWVDVAAVVEAGGPAHARG